MKRTETTKDRTVGETRIAPAGDKQTQAITHQAITREYVHSIRGKFRGKGLLKALMEDRKNQRES